MSVEISREDFGITKDGQSVEKFTFTGPTVTVSVLNYGGAICSVLMPDMDGKVEDIAWGFDDIAGYEENPPYLGAICGRVAGRIAGGKFTLDGQTYRLPVNNGLNSIHGGLVGFSRRVWDAAIDDRKLVLTYKSPDGEEGYPGEITTTVTYSLSPDGALTMDYSATTTKPCPFNLTSHGYFNLAGPTSSSVFDHVVQINAKNYVPVDDDLVPTGELPPVSGTPVDLQKPTELAEREAAIRRGDLDITYVVGTDGQMKNVARVEHGGTGRYMEAATTAPGLQFYTSKYLEGVTGKAGKQFVPFSAFCLEAQHYPDSINHSNFPDTVLRPGETYRQTTVYRFGVK